MVSDATPVTAMMQEGLIPCSFSNWRILLVETRPSMTGIEMSGRSQIEVDGVEMGLHAPIKTKLYGCLDSLYFSSATRPSEAMS